MIALCLIGGLRAETPDAGFLYDEFPLTLAAGHRAESFGPLFYEEQNDLHHIVAMPPFWSDAKDAAAGIEEFDVLYPFLTLDRFGSEYRFQILQLFSFAGGQQQTGSEQRRFTIFPLYFQQRSTDTNLNYTALFPFYGRLLGRPLNMKDETFFVMFPLYAKTRKRDVVTENYFYPFVHLRQGNQLTGWQVWPLVGHEQKQLTYKTNLFDTVEPVAGHDKWFYLWPFCFDSRTGLGTTNAAAEFAILPAYSQFRSAQRDSTSVLWPFFNYIDDRGKQYREWQTPYPLIVFARGEGKTANRIWPFFGEARTAIQSSEFYAWPIYQHRRLLSEPLDRERTRIFFFLYSDVVEKNTATGDFQRRKDFFPFFTWRRNFGGSERLQVLAPVEPFLPNNKSIERNYSPLWSFWRAEQNPKTGADSQSLLWNLYRRENDAGTEKISLLFGLFHYQSAGADTRWRLLYIPVGKNKPAVRFQPLPEEAACPAGVPQHPQYEPAPVTP